MFQRQNLSEYNIESRFGDGTAAVAIAAVVLVMIWGGVSFLSTNRQQEAVLTRSKPAQVQPQINPLEVQQRQAIDTADKSRAAGNLQGAAQVLKDAASLNGPLDSEIQKKLGEVQLEMNNESLAQVRRKEEQLWQQAKSDVDRGQFEPAKKALEQIRQIPEGQGIRKEEAQTYVNQVIPQRQHEEDLLAQAKQAVSMKDRNSLTKASALSDQIIRLGGPRKAEAERLRQSAQNALNTLDKQQLARQVSVLEADARLYVKQGNFPSARQKVGEIKQAGGDTNSLSAEIDKAEAAAQTRQQDDVNYQQAVQKYKQAVAANDKSGIDAARDSFTGIAQSGGPHATEAGKYVSEINERNTTSQLAPPPVAKQETSPPNSVDEAAGRGQVAIQDSEKKGIQAALDSFNKAFQDQQPRAVKEIWPSAKGTYLDALRVSGSKLIFTLQPTGAPAISGNAALIPCDLTSETILPGGKMTSIRKQVKVHLYKSGDRWLFSDPFGQ